MILYIHIILIKFLKEPISFTKRRAPETCRCCSFVPMHLTPTLSQPFRKGLHYVVLSAHADKSLKIKDLLSESQASLIPLHIQTYEKKITSLPASSYCTCDLSHKSAYTMPNYRPPEIKSIFATVVLNLPSSNSVMLQMRLPKRQGSFKQTQV